MLINNRLLLFVVSSMFYFVNTSNAQQQTYTLETSTFRLILNKYTIAGDGYATGIRECRYLPTATTFSIFEGWTTIANVDSSLWSEPLSVVILDSALGVKNLAIYFTGGKRIVMRVTSHTRFLEFELLNVMGDCGDIRLFGPIFCRLPQGVRPGTRYEFEQVTYLGNGYYVCLIAANPNTVPFTHWNDDSTVLVMTLSPRYLPTSADSSYRNQRFAFFICRDEEVKDIVREVENYFNYPYGITLKDNPENDIDYLFLMGLNGASAQDIIQLCRNTELGAVMLYQDVWADYWLAQDEPFKIRPGIKQFIDSLKSEGIIVGLHSYVHVVPRDGYYAVHYPTEVSTSIIDGCFRAIKWTGPLPDIIVQDYVTRVLTLEPDWIYFDANGMLYEDTTSMQITTRFDPYLDGRMTRAIMYRLWLNNYDLKIFQDAGGNGGYNFKSRIGQIDYWDPHPITGRNPIEEMDFCASQAVYRNRGLFTYTDLGWFGREIHIPTPPYNRDARWDEWQHLAYTSLTYDIPMGIRTTYSDFMTDPLRDSIIPLLRETIRLRRGLHISYPKGENKNKKALLFNYPNPIKDKTTILFNLPVECFVTLKVYDVSGEEVSTLISRKLPRGSHTYNLSALSLANGIYFCRLLAEPVQDGYGKYLTATNKIILLK